MTDRKQIILGILLLLAVGLSSWLGLQKAFYQDTKAYTSSDEPDAFMETIIAKRMDINGNLENELRSPRMDHYTKTNTTHLIEPSLILYSKRSDPPWYITALHGRAHKGTEWIELWDKVKGYRPAGTTPSKQAAITFLTDAATLFPDKKYAKTDRPVEAVQGGLTMNGVGMQVDLQKDEVELLSKVKSRYVPTT